MSRKLKKAIWAFSDAFNYFPNMPAEVDYDDAAYIDLLERWITQPIFPACRPRKKSNAQNTMNRALFTTNRFGIRWGGFLMPFLRNGGETRGGYYRVYRHIAGYRDQDHALCDGDYCAGQIHNGLSRSDKGRLFHTLTDPGTGGETARRAGFSFHRLSCGG